MPRFFAMPKKVIVAAGLLLAVVALCVSFLGNRPAAAQPADQPAKRLEDLWKEKKFTYQEAGQCMGCHTAPNKERVDKGAFDVCLLTEYAIWKTHDKHAQAYAVLEGPRGKEIARLLGKKGAPLDVRDAKAGCLGCHAMNDLSAVNQQIAGGKGLDPQDGVSCGGCHGPSSDWVNAHADKTQWRNKLDAKQKAERGFRDLRDPVVRAELCLSCHVGNARDGRVVTHAMMAAGHPPLPPLEMAMFSKNEPQHWREPKDTPAFKDWKGLAFQQTRSALIGDVVAVRETLKLVRDRANFSADKPAYVWPELLMGRDWSAEAPGDELRKAAPGRWPELAMAHSDCFACHHDLKYPGYRQQRGFGYAVPGIPIQRVVPGRPLVRSWPLAALGGAAAYTGNDKKLLDDLQKQLHGLAAATSRRPFGRPEQMASAADGVIKWCDTVIADLRKATYDEGKARRLFVNLCSLFEAKDKAGKPLAIPDYETARDVASLLVTVAEDLKLKDEKVDGILNRLDKELDLRPYSKRMDRVQILLDIIRSAGKVPANVKEQFDKDAGLFSKYLMEIGNTKFLLDDVLGGRFRNEFLQTLSSSVSNSDFTKGLLDKPNIDRLQAFSDEEQRGVLKAVAGYDPQTFVGRLKELKDIVNKK